RNQRRPAGTFQAAGGGRGRSRHAGGSQHRSRPIAAKAGRDETMDDRDERIRQRAHAIWEEEGRPEGREYSHWLRARAAIRAEEAEAEPSDDQQTAVLPTSGGRPPGKVPEERERD